VIFATGKNLSGVRVLLKAKARNPVPPNSAPGVYGMRYRFRYSGEAENENSGRLFFSARFSFGEAKENGAVQSIKIHYPAYL